MATLSVLKFPAAGIVTACHVPESCRTNTDNKFSLRLTDTGREAIHHR
jgi:hypothetical protein